MSKPDERTIEKQLRAAGAGRREQAGEPEMHPAMRETLQTEVRRQYGAPAPRPLGAFKLWLKWLPQVAVFVALGVCVWLWLSPEQANDVVILAKKESLAQSTGEERRSLAPAMEVGIEVKSNSPADEEDTLALESSKLVLVQSSDADDEARRVVGPEPIKPTPASVVGADYLKSDRQDIWMGTASSRQTGGTGTAVEAAAKTKPRTELSADAAVVAQPGPAASQNTVTQTAVLQQFTVLNDDEAIQFIDADGSTYAGTMQSVPPSAVADAGLPHEESRAQKGARAMSQASDSSSTPVVLAIYSFSVSGTNRTLGRPVVFSGNLALQEFQVQLGRNVFSNTLLRSTGNGIDGRQNNARQLGDARLSGEAVLSDSESVVVDAVIVEP